MKSHLIAIVAAVVLVGCGESQQSAPAPEAKTVKPAAEATDHSGTYTLSIDDSTITIELKPDGSFIGTPSGRDRAVGSWKVEGELLICEGTIEKSSTKIGINFNKTSGKLNTISERGKEMPIDNKIPEGADGIYVKKNSLDSSQAQNVKPEPPTGKAPDIDIHFAAMFGRLEAVKQYITAGADVNAIDDDEGMTPLILAAGGGHKKIVELLIAEGADVNAKDKYGRTPLLMAVLGIETVLAPVEKEIVELLIAKGADVNALIVSGPSEFKGKTPLDLAKRHPELTDLIRKHGGKTGEELKAEGK
jgi:hypothetical protein